METIKNDHIIKRMAILSMKINQSVPDMMNLTETNAAHKIVEMIPHMIIMALVFIELNIVHFMNKGNYKIDI